MVQLLRLGAMTFGFLMIGLTTSCQLVADIHTHEADPIIKGCELPSADNLGPNDGKIRLANLFPSKDTIDICIRPTNTTSYGRPVFRNSGQDKNNICGAGLAYAQVTYPFKVPAGNLDLKIIPSGKTCTADALVEAKNIAVTPEFGVTLAYMGSAAAGASLVPLTETPKATGAMNRKTRLVNAVAGTSLNFGTADTGALPAVLSTVTRFLKQPLEFGHAADPSIQVPGFFAIDPNGYLDFGSTTYNIVAALPSSSKAVLLDQQSAPGVVTLYAIGEPRRSGVKAAFPLRGLSCKDDTRDNDHPQLTFCTPTALEFISIDVYNAGLYGAFAAVESKRADPVLQAIARRGVDTRSDVMCVTEISRHEGLQLPNTPGPETDQTQWTQERLMRLANVPGGYKYFVQGKSDLTTPPTDPTAQDGTIPPAPTAPPCNPSLETDTTTIDGAYNCLATNCGSTGGFDGVTQGGTVCYSQKCTVPLAGWRLGSPAQKACINCMIANGLSYMTWEQNRTACTTDIHQSLAFNGTPTSMILSKFPVIESDQFVVGTTVFRRVALYAKLQYDPDTQMDFYCIHAPPLLGNNLPYTGFYGNGANPETGAAWAEEQLWGIKKIIAWINQKSQGRYAIVAGDWSSSATSKDANGDVLMTSAGVPLVADVNPDTVELLRSTFFEAVPGTPDYKPVCTRCPAEDKGTRTNPYNKGVQDAQLTLRVFIKDPWEENPTTADSLFFDDLEAIDFKMPVPDFSITKGPFSDTFGRNIQMTNPPSAN